MSQRLLRAETTARALARKSGLLPRLNRYRAKRSASYEHELGEAMLSQVKPADCVWDIGANVGYYSKQFSDLVGASGQVLAFEPAPASSAELRALQLSNVQVFEVALSDSEGQLPFHIEAESVSPINRLVDTASGSNSKNGVFVRAVSGDSFRSELDLVVPNVIKIDVEGFEEEVLFGLQRTLGEPECRAVFVEVHFGRLDERRKRQAPARMVNLLEQLGYTVTWLDRSHLQGLRTPIPSESALPLSIPVSVVIKTKNEQSNIATCLRTLKAFDEIFVVDSNSSDLTSAIAQEHGAQVINFTWNGRYPKKCQWCLENLPFSYEWVLFVDADERMTMPLQQEILAAVTQPSPMDGYFIGFDYVFEGNVLKHGLIAKKLVLFRRSATHFAEVDDLEAEQMGELEGHYQPIVDGPVGELAFRMVHDDHESLAHFFDRHNGYSDWEAIVRSKPRRAGMEESQSRQRSLLKTAFAHAPAKPLVMFVYGYVVQRGFLDGRAGFDFAVAKSFYYWQVGLKQRELKRRRASGTRRRWP